MDVVHTRVVRAVAGAALVQGMCALAAICGAVEGLSWPWCMVLEHLLAAGALRHVHGAVMGISSVLVRAPCAENARLAGVQGRSTPWEVLGAAAMFCAVIQLALVRTMSAQGTALLGVTTLCFELWALASARVLVISALPAARLRRVRESVLFAAQHSALDAVNGARPAIQHWWILMQMWWAFAFFDLTRHEAAELLELFSPSLARSAHVPLLQLLPSPLRESLLGAVASPEAGGPAHLGLVAQDTMADGAVSLPPLAAAGSQQAQITPARSLGKLFCYVLYLLWSRFRLHLRRELRVLREARQQFLQRITARVAMILRHTRQPEQGRASWKGRQLAWRGKSVVLLLGSSIMFAMMLTRRSRPGVERLRLLAAQRRLGKAVLR